jgi:hypothetical protein
MDRSLGLRPPHKKRLISHGVCKETAQCAASIGSSPKREEIAMTILDEDGTTRRAATVSEKNGGIEKRALAFSV